MRFEITSYNLENDLTIYHPDGRKFLTYVELHQQLEQKKQRAEQECQNSQDLLVAS